MSLITGSTQRRFERHIELQSKPIQEVIDLFEWVDGKVEFDLFVSSPRHSRLFLADDLFAVVQQRQDEIRALGHKVKMVEEFRWYTIKRKYVVYDLEHSGRNFLGLNISIILGLLLFISYFYAALK